MRDGSSNMVVAVLPETLADSTPEGVSAHFSGQIRHSASLFAAHSLNYTRLNSIPAPQKAWERSSQLSW